MKPIIVNGKLEVVLQEPDIRQLHKARELGQLLVELRQDEGTALVNAIDAIFARLGVGQVERTAR